MPKILYTYLIAFTNQHSHGIGTGRAIREVDRKLNSQARIEAIERHLRSSLPPVPAVQILGITNLVLLKRRIGRLVDPVVWTPAPAEPQTP